MNVKTTFGIVFLVFLIMLSGCINLQTYKGEFVTYSEMKTNDLDYAVDLYPSSLVAGEKLKLRIKLTPKKDIENVKVSIVDSCVLTPSTKEKSLGDIPAESQKIVDFSLTASSVEMTTQCKVKFKIEYEAEFNSLKDIAVLSSAEYKERALSGTLTQITTGYSKTPSSMEIETTFSEQEPFREGKEMYMYIDYYNKGNGIAKSLKNGDVIITIPDNLQVKKCSDYSISGNKLTLSSQIEFHENKGKTSVCELVTKANLPVDIKKLSVYAKYKYEIEDYITVEVIA